MNSNLPTFKAGDLWVTNGDPNRIILILDGDKFGNLARGKGTHRVLIQQLWGTGRSGVLSARTIYGRYSPLNSETTKEVK